MRLPASLFRIVLPLAGLATAVWLFLLWRPARQVALHTENLLERVSARDWPAVESMFAADYADAWDQDRSRAVDRAREVLSHFFALHITALDEPVVDWRADGARVSARLGVFGSGTGVAHAVMDEVQALREPFSFRWRKAGRWPWDWELASLEQPELEARFGGRLPEF